MIGFRGFRVGSFVCFSELDLLFVFPAAFVSGSFSKMLSRLLIGDNNLSRFWPSYQFGKANLKSSMLLTATDFDTLDHALSQSDEKEQVIISVLTSLLLEEISQDELESSVNNIIGEVMTRLGGLCPRSPSCQVPTIYSSKCFLMKLTLLILCYRVFLVIPFV